MHARCRALLLALTCLAVPVHATEYTWLGLGSSNNWADTTGNWDIAHYPGYQPLIITDTVLFPSFNSQLYNLTVAGTIRVASISVQRPGYSLTLNGTLIVDGGIAATYDNAPDITNNFGLTVGGNTTVRNLTGSDSLISAMGAGTALAVVGPSSSYSGYILDGNGGVPLSLTVGDGTHAASLSLLASDNGFFATNYSGTTLVMANATLVNGITNGLSASSPHVVNGALNLSGGSSVVKSLAGSGTVALGANTLTINTGGTTFSGSITGTGGVVLSGGGALTLTGTGNTYAGPTTIGSGGLLAVNGSIAGGVLVQNGATLGGSGTIGGAVTVQSGGALSPGNSPGQIALQNSLTLQSGSLLEMEIGGATSALYDRLDVQGLFTAGGTLDLHLINGYSPLFGDTFAIFNGATPGFDGGSFTITTNLGNGLSWNTSSLASTGTISVVPEPATWALLGFGLLVAAAGKTRRPNLRS